MIARAASAPSTSKRERGGAVALGEPEVVKHRSDVEQLQVRLQSAAQALQCSEEEHPPGMVEQQVVFDVTNELGDFARQRAIGYADAGNGFDGLNGS